MSTVYNSRVHTNVNEIKTNGTYLSPQNKQSYEIIVESTEAKTTIPVGLYNDALSYDKKNRRYTIGFCFRIQLGFSLALKPSQHPKWFFNKMPIHVTGLKFFLHTPHTHTHAQKTNIIYRNHRSAHNDITSFFFLSPNSYHLLMVREPHNGHIVVFKPCD